MRQTLLLLQLCLFAVAIGARAAQGAAPGPPHQLADSTRVQNWTLDNGLRVSTRHIPKADAVAITVAYDLGSDDDPPGREGLAMLMAELGYTAAAGGIPERSREDLDSQRPHGWSVTTTRRSIMFTEIAITPQFPGVLQQVAQRMRGVTVTREGMQAALATVRVQMKDRLAGKPEVSLYYLVREVGLGHDDPQLRRDAPGRELERMSPEAARQQIQRLLVPANAALSVVGNLADLDVPALIQNLFGSLPAGTKFARGTRDSLRAVSKSVTLAAAQDPRGVVGIIAPPLTDARHPAFYLCTMLLGTHFSRIWTEVGNSNAPPKATGSLFHYALFDEPDLVRLYPPGAATTDELGAALKDGIDQLYAVVMPQEVFEQMRVGLLWLLGGPMSEEQLKRARRDSSALHILARSTAGRDLFGGEAVWGPYRERFAALPNGGFQTWMDYYAAPEHQVRLTMGPSR